MTIFATHEKMSEADFQAAVIAYAESLGWLCYHPYDSRRSKAGWPDLVMVKGKYIIFAELKSEKGKESEAQIEWLDALEQVKVKSVELWRPVASDGEIKRLLERR